jgi:MFS family permease
MYRKNIRLLSIFNFLIGFSLFAPIAIIYFSKVSGSYILGASVFGITMLASAIFEIPTGVWSDRLGRKGTVIMGSWARVVAYFLYAIGLSYGWLVIGAILEGLSRAFYSGNNDALLRDTLEDDGIVADYHVHLGKTSSTEHLALGISGLIGGILATYSFTYAMWLTALVQCGLIYVSYKFIEPRSRSRLDSNIYSHIHEAVRLFVQNKKLRILSLASILRFAIGEMKFQFRAAFINTLWPLWAIGITNTISFFGASASFYFSGKIIKKYNELKVLMFQTIYGKILSFIAYGIPSVISPILLMTPSFLHGVGSVSENNLLQAEFTSHQRATMSSLNSLGGSVIFFFTSLLLGGLADAMGPAKAMIIMTILELPVIYLYLLLFQSEKKKI